MYPNNSVCVDGAYNRDGELILKEFGIPTVRRAASADRMDAAKRIKVRGVEIHMFPNKFIKNKKKVKP